jgi:hypothetical protein
MKRWDIINQLIEKNNYKSYLEIGVNKGQCFLKIKCAEKIGVDPDKKSIATVFKTSDKFFSENNQKFDIIFIDGLHEQSQVYRDISNSLYALNDGGSVVCHDMLPNDEKMQIVPRVVSEWTGDGWKAWIRLKNERKDLDMFVINADYGVGIIRKKSIADRLEYSDFENNKNSLMNIVSVEEFEMKTIVVLGMHRSSTSLIARTLNKEVHMGDKLLKNQPDNPKGHYENIEALKINKQILQDAGGDWYDPPERDKIIEVGLKYTDDIKELVSQEIKFAKSKNMQSWGFKDPRTVLTIDVWHEHLPNPQFIVCYRNALDVARSLQKRNGISLDKGVSLTNEYNRRISEFISRFYGH